MHEGGLRQLGHEECEADRRLDEQRRRRTLRLIEATRPKLTRSLVKKGFPLVEVEDAVSDAVLKLLELMPTVQNPEGWLYMAAYNFAVNMRRRKKFELNGFDVVEKTQLNPYENVDNDIVARGLVDLITHEDFRAAVMGQLLGYTNYEYAMAVGIDENTSKTRRFRGIGQIKSAIGYRISLLSDGC